MDFQYTKDQKKVIFTRNTSMLVSAAAGSGKTAVLVERIIKMITDEENPTSIDELLIVTFTKAAAGEMKERVAKGIEKAIDREENPQIVNHLIKQMALLPVANIMTMHSFCLKIIKEYYHLIDLDPTFKIGDDIELSMIQEEVIDELIEEQYRMNKEPFIRVVESFAGGTHDDKLKELIFRIYRFAMSNPWPVQWMDEKVKMLECQNVEAFEKSAYYGLLLGVVKQKLEACEKHFNVLRIMRKSEQGPTGYYDAIDGLASWHDACAKAMDDCDYSKLRHLAENSNVPRLGRNKKGHDPELAQEAKGHIETIRENMKQLKLICFDEEMLVSHLQNEKQLVEELVRLTKLYMEAYAEAKKDKNLIDFNDFEHFSLDLLYNQGKPSEIAVQYQKQFKEVLVDEYQDTNEVQEAVLTSLTKENNLFMVGDLKQSIYKFRLAKPEIFKHKYKTFHYEKGNKIKVDLSKNFRSRREVLDLTNEIFGNIMSEEIGDVVYDEHARLNLGSTDYPEEQNSDDYRAKLVIGLREDNVIKREAMQGKIIAAEIKNMIFRDELQVYDKEIGNFRNAEYKDVCVLLRSPASTVSDLKDALDEAGIPYSSDKASGFFETTEVNIVLNYLKIIDNPFQDIPLVSVLRSPIVGLKEQELKEIRDFSDEGTFYDAFMSYLNSVPEEMAVQDVITRGKKFMEQLDMLRKLSLRLDLYHLLEYVYQVTGFKYYVSLMENGQQRKLNLDSLKDKAAAFDRSSFTGLFNFIRYIDHVKKYDIEIPEPLLTGAENGIKIMSIHKSKGLEFPIVIVADLHKQFNEQDLKETFLIHQELGFACDAYDVEKRVRHESLIKNALKVMGRKELLSEEMRLLYVALTRAREKLVLIGMVKEEKEPTLQIGNVKSYLDYVLMGVDAQLSKIDIQYVMNQELDEEEQNLKQLIDEQKAVKIDLLNETLRSNIKTDHLNKMDDTYIHDEQTNKFISMSVSELKKADHREALFDFSERQAYSGTQYGTVIHKILSLLPIEPDYTHEKIKEYVDGLFDKQVLEESFKGRVNIDSIYQFTQSNVYKEVIEAKDMNRLYQEQPFVLGIPDGEDFRMIQGVIDMFYEREDGYVLVDYKTDKVDRDKTDKLLARYALQLDYYKRAIENIKGKPVKEAFIYSLSLNELIPWKDGGSHA